MILREAQATAAIENDHIVTIYQVAEDRGIPFLAMQLLQGETLEDRLQREPKLPLAEVLRIGRETAQGLAAAHDRGLMHRDIKPANIWLEAGSGRVKIVDFGLARAADDQSNLTQQGRLRARRPTWLLNRQAVSRSINAAICSASAVCCIGSVPARCRSPAPTR